MKKAILSSILLLSASSIFADTTMCFKENHQSMSTIENTPLDGGLCAGKNTIADMKAKGWNVLHIMGIDKVQEHKYTAPAKVVGSNVFYYDEK